MSPKTSGQLFWSIIILGLAIRLYGITSPLLDSHQLRQAQTAMAARNLFHDGMTVFCTRLDCFGPSKSCVIMEFPLMQALSAALYHIFGIKEIIGRLVSVVFSIAAMFAMYGLAGLFLSPKGSLWALALYAFSPMNIFFSRAFMPESSMMFFCAGGVYLTLLWLKNRSFLFFLSGAACTALALIIKPTSGIILVPIGVAWLDRDGWRLFRRSEIWLYGALTMAPMVLWGIYANLMNHLNLDVPAGFGGWLQVILQRGGVITHWIDPSFYLYVGGSVTLLLLTPVGLLAAAAGYFMMPAGPSRRIAAAWLAAVIAYFFALSGPNSGHVYYHLHLLPVAAIFFGYALQNWQTAKLWDGFLSLSKRPRMHLALLAVGLIIQTADYGLFFQYMYDTNLRMPHALEVSSVIKDRLPKGQLLVVNEPHVAAPLVLSYYAEASAWRFTIESDQQAVDELERLRRSGATLYVALNSHYGEGVRDTIEHPEFYRYLKSKYKPVAITDYYLIYDLHG